MFGDRKGRICSSWLVLLATGAITAPAFPVLAQEQAPGVGLEEIVVTARRRDENLQSTPISIAAFSANEIERRSITNIDDLGGHVANMSIISGQGGGGSQAQISLRGVGQSDFILTSDQSVGLYVDGIYIARSLGAALDLVDIERIEVLRGPQGTLFGRNTTAGAVQIVTQKPGPVFSGSVTADVGEYNRQNVSGGVNIPLSDRAFVRLSAATLNQDGYGKRLAQNTDGADTDVDAARLAIRLLPTDNFTVDIAVDGSSKRGHAGLERTVSIDPTNPNLAMYNAFLAGIGLPPADGRFITRDVHDTYAGARNVDNNNIFGSSLTMELALGKTTLRSISAYRQIESQTSYDFDGTPYPLAEQWTNLHQHQFSQELQALGSSFNDKLNWTVGMYYFKENAADTWNVPFYDPLFTFQSALDQETDSYAVYGQGTYHFTDALSATFGLRYTEEEKTLLSSLSGAFIRAPGTVSESWDDLSPRFGLEYKFADNTLVYGSVSRGYRSGGFNGRDTSPNPPGSFDPESIWAYEVGAKTDMWDGKLRLDGAFFYYDYSNFQGLTLDSFSGITITTGNIAKVELYGFEGELSAAPVKGLKLSLGAGYTHQDISEVDPNAAITIRPDTRLVNSPEWSYNASADYELPLTDNITLALHGDYNWRSSIEFFLPNYPDEGQSAYGVGNAHIAVRFTEPAVELQAYVSNIADEEYRVFAENGTALGVPATTAIYGPPRMAGVRLKYAF